MGKCHYYGVFFESKTRLSSARKIKLVGRGVLGGVPLGEGVCGRPGPSAGSETLAGAGARGILPPPTKNLRTKIPSTKKNRPLDNRIQVIYIIVNKCSNEQKVTNIPSFSSL